MRFGYIVFDYDGTLAESGIGIRSCVAYALEKLGRPVPGKDVLDKFIGPPLLTSFMEYCGMDRDEAERAVALYRERYSPIGLYEADIYPGITPMLRALKEKGVYLAVASGKPDDFLKRVVSHFGLDKYFNAVVGIEKNNHSSDKQAQILRALPEGVCRERVCMVGDRCFDVDSAKALGMFSAAVGYGYGNIEEFNRSGADFIAETVSELQDFLLEDTPRKGYMISFEGTDGCGKSTQIHRLSKYLLSRGYEVVLTREPGGCPISEHIRDLVLSLESKGMSAECEALLYAASRVEHVHEVILPALKSGKIVLCDRFLDSSIAYQAYGRELGEAFIRQINEASSRLVMPDCTLQFDIDREAAKARMAQGAPLDRLEVEAEDFFSRVARGYEAVAAAEPERIHRIDSGRDIETVFSDVLDIVRRMLDMN